MPSDRPTRVRPPRRPASRAAALAVLGLLAMVGAPALVAGCGGDGPRLSGFALGDTRIVSVGELVELRLPRADDGSRRWRVTSYDSYHLELIDNPQVVRGPDGTRETRVVARAKNVGESTLELTEVAPPGGGPPSVKRFTVRVTP